MHVCMHVCMNVCMYVCINVYIYIYALCVCCTYLQVSALQQRENCLCTSTAYTYIHTYIHKYIHIYIYIYIYIYCILECMQTYTWRYVYTRTTLYPFISNSNQCALPYIGTRMHTHTYILTHQWILVSTHTHRRYHYIHIDVITTNT